MTVVDLIEHEDGSATVHLDLSDEERNMLIQVGFVQILKDSIAAQEQPVAYEMEDEIWWADSDEINDHIRETGIPLYRRFPPAPKPQEQAQPDMSDAYVGCRDDLNVWKNRALVAEELNRKFAHEINGQTFMGEPAPPAPPAPKPLTIQQIAKVLADAGLKAEDYREDGEIEPLVRAIEAAHGIKE